MTAPTRRLPLRHLSVRVPWHDRSWNGSVCAAPLENTACLRLSRIAEKRDDDLETRLASASWRDLDHTSLPCCAKERGGFMSPFPYETAHDHPYSKTSPKTHGHFRATPVRHPPYSAAVVPFRWLSRKEDDTADVRARSGVQIAEAAEPDLGWESNWLQHADNHRAVLDAFAEPLEPHRSLVFFYASAVPLVEDGTRRVLVGVGRVAHIGALTEYAYADPSNAPLRSLVWERPVQHTIRPDGSDGFLLPYHAALEHARTHPDFDPASLVAFAPDERRAEFSYVSEHVSNDAAIGALLSIAAAMRTAEATLGSPAEAQLRWLDERLAELWSLRGPYPGLGAVLTALGVPLGSFVAWELAAQLERDEAPWPLVDRAMRDPKAVLSTTLARGIEPTLQKTWAALTPQRRALIELLCRFDLDPSQATLALVEEERRDIGLALSDAEILENPYRLFEATRTSTTPIPLETVDLGAFPTAALRDSHPIPAPSAVHGALDERRLRAWTIRTLEAAASEGHTLLARADVIMRLRGLAVDPPMPVIGDSMAVAETTFEHEIGSAQLSDGSPALQLRRLQRVGEVIRQGIVARVERGKPLEVNADWAALLRTALQRRAAGEQGREPHPEQVAALEVLARSRFSVLIGPAGTGKTTLLAALCAEPRVAAGGLLLLAPTGKARVRLAQVAGDASVETATLAQFLGRSKRYDADTQTYRLTGAAPEAAPATVIVDEASMLTEEMLAALLESLQGVQRLVLVGDPGQLPPIGAGRPFVDLVRWLEPAHVDALETKVGGGYARLSVGHRQRGGDAADQQLAAAFARSAPEPGGDDVFERIARGEGEPYARFRRWDTESDLRNLVLDTLETELKLGAAGSEAAFGASYGGTVDATKGYLYFNKGSTARLEDWQMLTAVRGRGFGSTELNRLVHRTFRAATIETARRGGWKPKFPKPFGSEAIVYGDKVINLANHRRHAVYPRDGAAQYVANGEVGLVTGQTAWRKADRKPTLLHVEFSTQPGFTYTFFPGDFGDEGAPPLELAHAITVHKAQGSEFGLVILVVPERGQTLSRELFYTALTRQRSRLIVLHQGEVSSLRAYTDERHSATARRLTNLLTPPDPVEVDGGFLERGLIHAARDGTLMRSKSEVIVMDALLEHRLRPVYERPLTFDGAVRRPDFTIEDDATGEVYYWEHLGMLGDAGYRARWEAKLEWYARAGILPFEQGGGPRGTLIVTRDAPNGGISSAEIRAVISQVILKLS